MDNKLKIVAAVVLHVALSLGGLLALIYLAEFSFLIAFVLFVLVLIPLADCMVSYVFKVNILKLFYR